MARKPKNQTPPQKLPTLPLRMLRLHAKLVVAVVVGIAVALLTPGDWRIASRNLAGWDVGAAIYLVSI